MIEANVADAAARDFLCMGIQEWGQPEAERARATANYLTEAGFTVEASGYPVFGGMFPTRLPVTGTDGEAATAWLDGVLRNLRRGKFETEIEQLVAALVERRKDS